MVVPIHSIMKRSQVVFRLLKLDHLCLLYIFDLFITASPLRKTELKEGLYTKREISPNYTLFWRIIPDTQEIEMAMRVKGTGYVGIGWRPKSATKQCQAYPKLYDKETAAKSLWLDNEKKQGKSAEPEAG